MELSEAIRDRYSVRKFKEEQIEEDVMMEILSVLEHSPTALNYQPEKVYRLKSAEAMGKINSASKCIYGAPEVLMICYDETECWRNPMIRGHKSGITDASIAADEIMLKAWELGVGTCFVGLFSDTGLQRLFDIPEYIHPVGLILIGYPADDCRPLAKMHNVSRPLEEMVFTL